MTGRETIQLDEETSCALGALATRLDRSPTALVHEAVGEWIAFQRTQIEEIEAGIADADAGRFATEEEVAAVFAKYGVDRAAERCGSSGRPGPSLTSMRSAPISGSAILLRRATRSEPSRAASPGSSNIASAAGSAACPEPGNW
jgi:predicted transcriptional regulator